MYLAQTDWGSVPDWLAGVGSILALIFAAAAAYAAFRSYKLQQAQVEGLLTAQRRQHASQIAAWMEGDQDALVCVVQNASQVPAQIVNVYLSIWFGSPRGDDGFGGWYRLQVGVLPPGERRFSVPGLGRFRFHLRAEASYVKAGVFFVDSSGAGWRRVYTGELEELSSSRYLALVERIEPGVWLRVEENAVDPDRIVGEAVVVDEPRA